MKQYNLPITTTYTIISSHYVSIEDGGGCCENCGRIISNIATIESKEGKQYTVGLDCAGTLSGIKGDFDFEYIHKANFNTAKQARAKLNKAIKEGIVKNLTFTTYETNDNYYKEVGAGKWEFERLRSGKFDGYAWQQYPAAVWQKYILPMIKDLAAVTNL